MGGTEDVDAVDGIDHELYMKRISDLDKPLPLDSPIFLPLRPDNTPPITEGRKGPVKMPAVLSQEEKDKLKAEYYESVKHPATTTFDNFPAGEITEILPGKAWVVPNLLSEEECENIISNGEAYGLKPPAKSTGSVNIRTNRRTDNWSNEELSIKIIKKFSEEVLKTVEASPPYTSVRGIHPNWRVASYGQGQTFPAHMDQSDSVVVQHPERVRQRFTSSHTLLIYLRQRGEQFNGGATRLFPDGKYNGATIDVCLPRGYGLIFQQRGLLHAGLPVEGEGVKYIAQAGLLRAEPQHISGPCAVFKYGPGLANF